MLERRTVLGLNLDSTVFIQCKIKIKTTFSSLTIIISVHDTLSEEKNHSENVKLTNKKAYHCIVMYKILSDSVKHVSLQ